MAKQVGQDAWRLHHNHSANPLQLKRERLAYAMRTHRHADTKAGRRSGYYNEGEKI
jgi:hypothetical protein